MIALVQQSNVIAGALTIAFIVFITLRGELPAYLDILRGGGATVAANNTQNTSIGTLPTEIDGTPLIVAPNASGNPTTNLLSNPSAFAIPQISAGAL